MELNRCYVGDCREILAELAAAGIRARMCVTSPPYWGLRDYGAPGQIGLEPTLADWMDAMREVFRRVWDVLADDGTLWLNIGDGYHTGAGGSGWQGKNGARADRRYTAPNRKAKAGFGGLKPKDLLGMPWRLAFQLQEDGWYLRSDIIWHKPNPMPESVSDRPTKAHEYLFLLSKSERYYYDADAIKEPSSPDTHARYRRGRSDAHKWADGGPYEHGQTIAQGFEHMARPSEAELRQQAIPVAGWDRAPGAHSSQRHARPVGDKLAAADETEVRGAKSGKFGRGAGWRKQAEAQSGIKNNDSFNEAMAVMTEDRNKRTVWTIGSEPFSDAHFATFPTALVEPCVLAGSAKGDVVLDPFMGSGTTAQVAEHLGRQWIGCELQPDYLPLLERRIAQRALPL